VSNENGDAKLVAQTKIGQIIEKQDEFGLNPVWFIVAGCV